MFLPSTPVETQPKNTPLKGKNRNRFERSNLQSVSSAVRLSADLRRTSDLREVCHTANKHPRLSLQLCFSSTCQPWCGHLGLIRLPPSPSLSSTFSPSLFPDPVLNPPPGLPSPSRPTTYNTVLVFLGPRVPSSLRPSPSLPPSLPPSFSPSFRPSQYPSVPPCLPSTLTTRPSLPFFLPSSYSPSVPHFLPPLSLPSSLTWHQSA